jgi:hypothetical protein
VYAVPKAEAAPRRRKRHNRSSTSLEASLLAAKAAATAFGLLRSVERPTVTAAVVAASAIAPTVVVACVGIRWWSEIALLARGPGAVFSDIEPQFAASDFVPVELLDRLGGVLFSCEPNECEPPGAPALTVLWNVNVNDLTDLSEELTKLLVCRAEVEVPYEYLT